MKEIEKIKKIIVVAPFNTPDVELKNLRVHTIAVYCSGLLKQGIIPVSALLSGLAFSEHCQLPTDTKTWINFNKVYVRGCDEMHILQLEGYLDSIEVQLEIAEAMELGIKIVYVPYELK